MPRPTLAVDIDLLKLMGYEHLHVRYEPKGTRRQRELGAWCESEDHYCAAVGDYAIDEERGIAHSLSEFRPSRDADAFIELLACFVENGWEVRQVRVLEMCRTTLRLSGAVVNGMHESPLASFAIAAWQTI